MKTWSRLAMAMALAFSIPAFADDAHHPETAVEAAAPAKATPPAPATVKQMQGNVKKMQAQLDRLGKARTDDERQKAMAEHMQTMMENMKLARGMQAGMMDCESMHGGMMKPGGMMMQGAAASADRPGPAPDRLQQLEKRMEMMERMMSGGDAGAPAK